MENNCITEEQYLQALEIVKRYDRQVSGQYLRMKDLLEDRIYNNAPSVIRKSPIFACDLSVRTLNCIKAMSWPEGLEKDEKEITVEEFYHIFKSRDQDPRNMGKKSINELEELFTKAGLAGHFTRHLE